MIKLSAEGNLMVRPPGSSAAAKPSHRTAPARVAGIYLIFSLVWMWLSDIALIRMGFHGESGFWVAVSKGSAFVLCSAGVLYLLIRREVRELSRALTLLRAVADGSTDAVFVKNRAGKYLLFNEAAAKFVGKPVSEVLGRDDTEVFDAPSAAKVMVLDREVMDRGRAQTHEEELTASGVTRTYLAMKAPYLDEAGNVIGLVGISRDVTERKRAAAFLSRQNAILEHIATGAPLAEVLGEIVCMVEEQLPGILGSILLLDCDGRLRAAAAPHLPDAYNAAIDGVAIGPCVGSCGTAAYTRKPVFVNDIATDPLWADYKELALSHGLRACWSVPIFAAPRGSESQAVLGTFAVYRREPGELPPRFVELIAQAQHVACIAIESERTASALRESEEHYRSLVESSADGIFVNAGERIVYANPALLRMVGADSPEQLIGRSPFDIIHPDFHPLARSRVRTLLETGCPVPFIEQKFVKLNGQPVAVEVAGAPFEHRGQIAIHVTARDITERIRAEQALREREEQLRTFVDHVWAPIAMFDRDLRYIHTSRRWLTDFHLGDRNIIGLGHYEVFPEIPERWKEIHRRCLAGAVERCEEDRFDRADGTVQWLRWEIQPWRQVDGSVGGVVMFTEDITHRKRMEAHAQQSQKMEAVGRLAGGIAHDFNNLLTVINGFSDFVLRELLPDDPHREALTHIRESGERAARLTQQLLAYSRKAMVEPKVLDLNELVTESAKLLRRLIGEDVTVTTTLQPGLDLVKVDRGQIEQVLMNLIVNARDAMPTGGHITIETRNVVLSREELPLDPDLKPGRYVRLTVTDTGLGMTDEVKANIFEPFFTTKGVGKGTGLGLAVVHGAVTQNGGHIGVTSEPGVGTTFTILFPRAETAPPASGIFKHPARGTETILLVEDEDAVRTITRIGLEGEGYTVLTASGAEEALNQISEYRRPIDLLVTDVVMPHIGGRQLAETLRARQPDLPVLFMSGYTDDMILRHGLAAATDNFLQKPFTPSTLAHKVREILDARA